MLNFLSDEDVVGEIVNLSRPLGKLFESKPTSFWLSEQALLDRQTSSLSTLQPAVGTKDTVL